VKYIPKEFAPGVISTGNGFSTAFEKDSHKVYFIKSSDEYKQVQKLYHSILVNGRWSTPVLDSFSEISNFITTPFISNDGNTMLFAANLNKMDLYISYKINNKWSYPVKLPGNVNSTEYHEYFGTLSNNKTLYFASDKGLGGGDIYFARYSNGKWENPTPIVDLNTELAESNPLIAPDESFLVFMAKRPEGFGDYDLYVSYNENGKWSKPLNLGPNINTGVKDYQPAFSPDGKFLFFSRVPWPSGSPAMYGNEYIYYIDINILKNLKR
jgi:Tol biopolymer transport system component